MKTLTLVLAFAAVAAAQKPLKALKHKPAYIAASPSGSAPESAPAYQAASPQASVSNHGGFGGSHGGGGFGGSHGSLSGKTKPDYPLLLSDTRSLNTDGTINFNYKADNGLHQGETVDSDGTRRGFYSYPGADGKLITVKYTAGKNGFVAEGDHLPTQPQSAPYNPKQESHDHYSSGKQGSSFGGGNHGGHYSAPVVHHGGHGGAQQYRPQQQQHGGHHGGNSASVYSHSSLGSGSGGHGGSNAFANFPDFSSQFSSGLGGKGDSSSFIGYSGPSSGSANPGVQFSISHQPQAQTQYNNVVGSPSYSSGGGHYSGAGASSGSPSISGHPGGSQSFSSLGPLGGGGGQGGHGVNLANFGGNLGAQYSGPMFTNANPYQPSNTAPVNAGFDLGNGGHFSINFTPGVGQEYNPNSLSGDYSSQGLSGHQGGGGQSSYAGSSGHGGAQGRY